MIGVPHLTLRSAAVILGPPAAGKSTAVATVVSAGIGVCHFKVREHLTRLLHRGDPVAVMHADEIRRRATLDDSVVEHGFRSFVHAARGKRAILVEGYPRNSSQFIDMRRVLAGAGVAFGGVVLFDAPDSVLRRRRETRRVCQVCDDDCPSVADGTCGRCGAALVPRADDEVERFEERLRQFRSANGALIRLFEGYGKVVKLDAQQPPDPLAKSLSRALGELNGEKRDVAKR